jgi:nitroreductase
MDLIEAIKSRKSVRGFKPAPVPKEIISEILTVSVRAPSGDNCQPWEFMVLGGSALEDLNTALREQFNAGAAPHPDFIRKPFTGVYRNRARELNTELFRLLDISREDSQKKKLWTLKMLGAYDAPNLILIYTDAEALGLSRVMFGIGALSQNIALAALHFGLGTCLLGAVTNYPEVVREMIGIPQSKIIAIGIGIGYPDWDFPANRLQSAREPIENITTWIGV